MKGLCKSLVELEYFLEEVCKATTDQLDWNNPEGQQYPHDLRKPLPLIPNSRGRRVIPFDHFIKNELCLSKWWCLKLNLCNCSDKDKSCRLWTHQMDLRLHPKLNVESKNLLVMSTLNTESLLLQSIKWHNYKHLDWITVRRNDDKLYTFKEGNYNRLRLQDIEDMLLLLVQGKLTNLNVEERLALGVSLQMFTRSVVLRRRVEDLQLGFSDGTLNDVRSALDDILKRIRMEYLPQTV
ncbi:hypothetical protein Tco_1444451 [Tanacetum coccineum]